MSAFSASVWAMRFDGVPPMPSVEILRGDYTWDSIDNARHWISVNCSELCIAPAHAVFLVGRDCNTLVLNWHEALHGTMVTQPHIDAIARLKAERDELKLALTEACNVMERMGTTDAETMNVIYWAADVLRDARAVLKGTEPK